MHDPMKWALPLYRAFGIAVKVHLLFFIITIPMFLRLMHETKGVYWWFDLFMLSVGVVFGIVLLHEYGHCFAARKVGGEANEIMIWPLGGLAYVEVPSAPKPNFLVAAAGPAVNLVLCLVCAVAFLAGGFSPLKAFNPFGDPFRTPTYHLTDGQTYTSIYGAMIVRIPAAEGTEAPAVEMIADKPILPAWAVWNWRICWMSWWLFLFNVLIPAYPMDGGRMLHAILWARSDYRTATITSCYVGYGAAAIMFGIGLFANEAILLSLAIFIGLNCYRTLSMETETERGAFGYDFSQGYTSLERDDPPPKPRRKGLIRSWLDARKARKIQREQDQRQQDELRMDSLLDKIAKQGKQSLTDEERRFMERVSARYRNK